MVIEPTPPATSGNGPRLLVLRFHSLGDCVLATGVTRALAATGRVTVATDERFRPVFAGLPWLDEVLSREELERGRGVREGRGGTWRGPRDPLCWNATDPSGESRDRPAPRFDRVIDLQGTPGARWLSRSLGRESVSVRTRSAERRWLVLWGDRFPRPRVGHAVARYAEAAGIGAADALTLCRPELRVSAEEEGEARRLAPEVFAAPAGTAVAIVTGASRCTKEYPAERFAEVAHLLRDAGLAAWWIEPPGVGTDLAGNPHPASNGNPDPASAGNSAPAGDSRPVGVPGPAGQPGAGPPGARQSGGGGDAARAAGMPVLRLPLGPLKAVLAHARAVVVSDSGPMHMAAALDVPVLGIFGSTVAGFGFAPLGPRARLLEVEDLACRPCGVHGRDRCWLGHWRCLRDLSPALVATELLDLVGPVEP